MDRVHGCPKWHPCSRAVKTARDHGCQTDTRVDGRLDLNGEQWSRLRRTLRAALSVCAVVAMNSHQLVALVPRAPTATQAPRLYGVGTKMATPSATPAVYTSNYTMSVSTAASPVVSNGRHCFKRNVKRAKSTIPHEECWWGAYLPYLGLKPVCG